MDIVTETIELKFTNEYIVCLKDDRATAHCVYALEADYTFNHETEDFDTTYYVLIKKLFVARDHRRQGIGRALFRAAVDDAKKRFPRTALKLVVRPLCPELEIDDLVAFYESEGFSVEQADEIVVMSC